MKNRLLSIVLLTLVSETALSSNVAVKSLQKVQQRSSIFTRRNAVVGVTLIAVGLVGSYTFDHMHTCVSKWYNCRKLQTQSEEMQVSLYDPAVNKLASGIKVCLENDAQAFSGKAVATVLNDINTGNYHTFVALSNSIVFGALVIDGNNNHMRIAVKNISGDQADDIKFAIRLALLKGALSAVHKGKPSLSFPLYFEFLDPRMRDALNERGLVAEGVTSGVYNGSLKQEQFFRVSFDLPTCVNFLNYGSQDKK